MAAARRLAMEARRSMADTRDLELQHRLEALAASQEAEIERLVDVSRDTNPCEGCPALIG
ncbi:hypothetical protein HY032_03770 [Candidatus Gottesmanbacteria bacterium]|nr:hypothetical protein [Candidatus Gottesmanbacteria bacterium]